MRLEMKRLWHLEETLGSRWGNSECLTGRVADANVYVFSLYTYSYQLELHLTCLIFRFLITWIFFSPDLDTFFVGADLLTRQCMGVNTTQH